MYVYPDPTRLNWSPGGHIWSPRPESPIEFRGTTRDYFGIWVVSLCLSILTLGVYSATAKVRTKRYFLGTTRIDGDALDYHATAGQILFGRVVAVSLLAILSVLSFVDLTLLGIVQLVIAFLTPWATNRALRFNARQTSWRNVRFDFHGTYWRAFRVFVVMPAIGLVTFGLLLPYAACLAARYVIEGYRFGTARFHAGLEPSWFYVAAIQALFVTILIVFVLVAALVVVVEPLAFGGGVAMTGSRLLSWTMVFYVFGSIGAAIGGIYYIAHVRNAVAGAMTLDDGHRFTSRLSGQRLAWIFFSNFVAIVLSLGLLLPWARIRRARYERSTLFILAAGPLTSFHDSSRGSGGATAGELGDLGGIGV